MNLEINRLLELEELIHYGLLTISLVVLVLTYIPNIIASDIRFIIRAFSIAFAMMVALNYILNAGEYTAD